MGEGEGTYGVARSVLLLRAEDGTAALGLVECALASDDCLALCAATASLASNLRDGIPVVHYCDRVTLVVKLKWMCCVWVGCCVEEMVSLEMLCEVVQMRLL